MAVIINDPNSDFKYNPDIILNNWSFNLSIGAVIGVGVIATLLACVAPKASKPFEWFSPSERESKTDTLTSMDTVDKPDDDRQEFVQDTTMCRTEKVRFLSIVVKPNAD